MRLVYGNVYCNTSSSSSSMMANNLANKNALESLVAISNTVKYIITRDHYIIRALLFVQPRQRQVHRAKIKKSVTISKIKLESVRILHYNYYTIVQCYVIYREIYRASHSLRLFMPIIPNT